MTTSDPTVSTVPTTHTGQPPITIDPELSSLIPPLAEEESRQLEANILTDGCRDPLIVWQEQQVLLDGHNRYAICTQHNIPYTIKEVSLRDRDSAKDWMVDNQLGRRNLTPEQAGYFRGSKYNALKNSARGGGDHRSQLAQNQNHQSDGNDTATILAAQYKVGRATIERDASYARDVNTIADVVGVDARRDILARDTRVTRQDVKAVAHLATEDPQAAKDVWAEITTAPTRKAAKQVVTQAVGACVICHRPLTDPDSLQRGISPVCACEKPSVAGPGPTPLPSGLPATPVVPVGLEDLLRDALRSTEALVDRLEGSLLPDALEPYREIAIALGRQCHRVADVLANSHAVRALVVPSPDTSPSPAETPQPRTTTTPPPRVPNGARHAYGAFTAQIAHAARELGRSTCADIAKRVDSKPGKVWEVLQRLVKKGELTQDDKVYIYVGNPSHE